MMLRHKKLLILSGLVWFAAGSMLLVKGIDLLLLGKDTFFENSSNYPLLSKLAPYFSDLEQATLLILVFGLILGFFKGKFVLGKTAKKAIARLKKFPNPTSLTSIYSAKYSVLLLVMIGLGVSMNYFQVPIDIRGFIDVAVGSALINGSMFYFRSVSEKEVPVES